jgi:hypothetical protein
MGLLLLGVGGDALHSRSGGPRKPPSFFQAFSKYFPNLSKLLLGISKLFQTFFRRF